MGCELTYYGISFGGALAIAISFHRNESILWAVIHGFFGWFYVLYYLLTKTPCCSCHHKHSNPKIPD